MFVLFQKYNLLSKIVIPRGIYIKIFNTADFLIQLSSVIVFFRNCLYEPVTVILR